MASAKRVSIGRILTLTTSIALIGLGACLLTFPWTRARPIQGGTAPWLPLPPDGMDASQHQIRMLLITRSGSWESARDSLAWRCGDGGANEPPEQYQVEIGDPWLTPNQQIWDVTMIPHGRQMEVRIADGGIPPPPPELGDGRPVVSMPDPGPTVHWVDMRTIGDIREAWSDQALWLAPQADVNCMDGMPVALQACVRGRYAARHRGCDGSAYEAAERLWSALKSRFPPPHVRP